MKEENPMRQIRIEKVTLNIGTGGPGTDLDKAMKLLKKITDAKPIQTASRKRIPTWKIRPGLAIGCKVTIRGKKAEELLKRLLQAVDNRLKPAKFDKEGNFSFGIPEYLDIPQAEYDMEIGIIGLEVAVTLQRPGYRIRRRKAQRKKIPVKQKISKDEAINFMQEKFGVKVR